MHGDHVLGLAGVVLGILLSKGQRKRDGGGEGVKIRLGEKGLVFWSFIRT